MTRRILFMLLAFTAIVLVGAVVPLMLSTIGQDRNSFIQDTHAMANVDASVAQPRLAIAKHSRAVRPQPIPRFDDVLDLVTDVVHSTRRIALEKGLYRRGRAERFEQLDLGVRQLDKDDRDAMRRERAWL